MRELDKRLGFSEPVEQRLTDPRGKNTQLPLADLPRQSVYSRLAGYEDVNDAEWLAQFEQKAKQRYGVCAARNGHADALACGNWMVRRDVTGELLH